MEYLFAAYAIFWGLTFVYVFSLIHRQRNLAREMEDLKRAMENSKNSSTPDSQLPR